MFSIFKIPTVFAQTTPEELVGEINVPKGVDLINADSGSDIGIIFFMSNMLKLATIVAGVWIMMNVLYAGFQYITGGGKAETHTKVRDRISMSVMGLLFMVAAYTIAAVIGLVFYGDPTYILSPTIDPIVSTGP